MRFGPLLLHLAAGAVSAIGCARSTPAPAPTPPPTADAPAPSSAPSPSVVALAAPTPSSSPRALPPSAPPAPNEPPAPDTVTLRFVVLDQSADTHLRSGRETFFTELELVADTKPPQRLAIGKLHEPGCRLGYAPDELETSRGKPLGGLVCYYAGYGDYVTVADVGNGKLVVSTYGQREMLIGDEHPPHEHARVVGVVSLPKGARAAVTLVEPESGATLP